MKVILETTSMAKREKTGHGYYVSGLFGALTAGMGTVPTCRDRPRDKETEGTVPLRGQSPTKEGLSIVPLSTGRKSDLNTWQRLWWDQLFLPLQARRERADLLHLTAFSIPLFYRGKKVVTVHDLALKYFPENLRGVSGWFLGRFVPWTFKFADHIIAVSESTKRDIVKFLSIPASKISVVYEGAPQKVEFDQSEAQQTLDKFGLKAGRYFLFVGTLEPRKNIPFIIEVLTPILKENPSYKLVLAGKRGWQYERVESEKLPVSAEARAEVGKVKSLIIETGYITDKEKAILYSNAAIFCYPSRYEGFGLPILEAFVYGCPVITADNSSLPEVAGDAALVLSLNIKEWQAAIRDLIKNQSKQSVFRQKGLERVEKFTWQGAARKTRKIYEALLIKR